MAFDAGMVLAISRELNERLSGARIDKILMPERDEIHLVLHLGREVLRLVVSASTNNPRIHLTDVSKENPATPPAFCMLLRKHLLSSRISNVRQIDFERVAEIEFDFKDEMGYSYKKYLIAELMGKHSNIIFLDGDRKILGAIRTTDLSDATRRILLNGIRYSLPPSQNKTDPTKVIEEEFYRIFDSAPQDTLGDKFLVSAFLGVSPLIAREAVYRASSDVSARLFDLDKTRLWQEFSGIYKTLVGGETVPTLICRKESAAPFEYAFIDIRQYGSAATVTHPNSVSELINGFFTTRDREDRIKQRSQDIYHLLLKSQSRLLKKIELQEGELRDTDSMEYCRRCADLISQEMYRIKRGDSRVIATDYSEEGYPEVEIELDTRLSPSQNAQRYYKKYNRKKNARIELTSQIEEAREELRYIDGVLDALSRASTESDLDELREELFEWKYGKRDKKKLHMRDKKKKIKPLRAISPSGLEVYIGKNNIQNDYITTKLSEKGDWWFHVKNFAGSHVVMRVKGEEPPAEDFTFAASMAALHSSAEGENIAVDYTLIKHVKKPPASKPGFVTYSTYWTAYVTPNKEELEKTIEK